MGRENNNLTLPSKEIYYSKRQEPFFSLSQLDYLGASLTDTSLQFSTAGLLQRFEFQSIHGIRDSESLEIVYEALQLAILGHKDSRDYKGAPYINHPLRVAIRLMRDYDVDDPHILAAALGHDLVEDEPKAVISIINPEFCLETIEDQQHAQNIALNSIGYAISRRSSELITSVTNAPSDPDLDKAKKNLVYLNNVGHKINSNFDTFLIKLSDFIDNGVGLHYGEDPEKSISVAQKYLPVYPTFAQAVVRYCEQGRLTRHQQDLSIRKLDRGRQRAQDILQAA